MSIHSARSRTFSTNSLFAAFSLGGIGWGLLHVWGVSVKTGIFFHALAAIQGLVLSGAVLYRYRQHWPVNETDSAGSHRQDLKLPWDYRAVAIYLLLIGVGFGIAPFISAGSAFFLVLAIIGMVLVPWSKIAVCRDHFFISSALVEAGALSGLVVLGGPVHPLYYPMAAWVLLAGACVMIFTVIIVHGNRLDRMPVSGY